MNLSRKRYQLILEKKRLSSYKYNHQSKNQNNIVELYPHIFRSMIIGLILGSSWLMLCLMFTVLFGIIFNKNDEFQYSLFNGLKNFSIIVIIIMTVVTLVGLFIKNNKNNILILSDEYSKRNDQIRKLRVAACLIIAILVIIWLG